MGCDDANPGNSCQGPQLRSATPLHAVYLDAYYIDEYEVTNAQYRQWAGDGWRSPAHHNSYTRSWYYGNPEYANHPVVWVTWNRARLYCEAQGKRLPTEAEWEKAARGGGDTRMYPWGNEPPSCTHLSCEGDTAAGGSHPAGASPHGVHDMTGNVREWVADWMHSGYYSISPYENPPGGIRCTSGNQYECSRKVVRGGSVHSLPAPWTGDIDFWRVSTRGHSEVFTVWPTQDYASNNLGFRCAADVP